MKDNDPTFGSTVAPTRAAPTIDRTPAPRTPTSGRFTPGSIVAGRYRLVALLGRGGMGEVYRADDLTLDQPVALKFLPDGIAADDSRLAQFHNELRIARQVSHKNVCRLYDLGDADGRRFLTMEYVDGEDLASLLRRIGRFPQDKAIDVARQLCAGVAAAHERGVLHRDLKPANVMLDGEGNVRITDFGIATAADDAGGALAGTPQYMAPEQLAGAPASIKTDIYALGLILFEIFTGRRAYDAKTIADLKLLHDTGTTVTPTSVVPDLDSAVERVILRSLDRDPARRPTSALAIAAALPGGNPLADALAAGETPSPELIVAAAETEAMPVLRGLALVAVLLAGWTVYAVASPQAIMANLVPLEKAPAVLADRAQQIRTAFGHVDMVADSGDGFTIAPDYPRWLVETVKTADRWSPEHVSAGPAVLYWYRTSPRSLSPLRPSILITPTDPPFTMTGMTLTLLDSEGRLQEFHAVPAQHDPPQGSTPSPPWPAVFDAAGLPMSSFAPAEPEWTPRDFADTRMAWTGARANRPDIPLRVEAAAYRGTIVSVYIIGPWSRASRMTPLTQSALNRALSTFSTMLWMSVLGGAVLFARHNMRANRADRRSAARLAATFLIAPVVAWTVGGHHLSGVADEAQGLVRIVGTGLIGAAIVWTLYLALEPYGRRFWPDGLLGWTRLFSGHVRDPRIGREILVGAALGAVLMMIDLFRAASPPLFGQPSAIPVLGASVDTLIGPGRLVIEWMQQFYNSVQTALIIVMLFVLMKLLVRHTLVAAILLTLIGGVAAGSNLPTGGPVWINAVAQVAAIALMTFAIVRFGLLVTAVLLLVDNIPTAVPFTTHGGAWAVTPGRLSMLLVLAIVGFGFYAARAGQPLFGKFEV